MLVSLIKLEANIPLALGPGQGGMLVNLIRLPLLELLYVCVVTPHQHG